MYVFQDETMETTMFELLAASTFQWVTYSLKDHFEIAG